MAAFQPRWQRKPGERPGQILSAALDAFAADGYAAATMDGIAERAGITKGTIYLYFSSKEALFLAAIRDQFERAFKLLPEARLEPGQDLQAFASNLGRAFLDVLMSPGMTKAMPLFIAEYGHVDGLRELYYEEVVGGASRRFAAWLEQAMDLGLMRPMDPLVAARSLFGMFFIFALTQEVFGAKEVTPLNRDAIAEGVVGIYLKGVLSEELP